MALVKRLTDAGWVRNVLFLADRTALVEQAAKAFKEHLPDVATINLVKERGGEGRVFVSTYPTMMNVIKDVGSDKRQFGPGFFDLVIIDEAHRSAYQKFHAIFDYFDALLVGLTTTPKDDVDRNRYELFGLEAGVPTDSYSLEEAVSEGYLVPYQGLSAGTKFLSSGVRYSDLPEDEREQWESAEWGDEIPGEITSAEMNRYLFNTDTVDLVLATLTQHGRKVDFGNTLAKTIVFAANQNHADFIKERFDLAFPERAGKDARVITHREAYAQSLLEEFEVPSSPLRIAISIDMLDTGVDIPEVANLVFFKQVRSKTKFWQMIGRGTRLSSDLYGPGDDKRDFMVLDFCGNLDYFGQDPVEADRGVAKSLNERLFELRMDMLNGLRAAADPDLLELRSSIAAVLAETVAGMNVNNVLVRPHRRSVEELGSATAWLSLRPEGEVDAVLLGKLPSSAIDSNEDAKRFDLLVLRRQVADLQGDAGTADRMRKQTQGIAAGLLGATAIPAVAEQAALLEEVSEDAWWEGVTIGMLESMRERLRGLLQFLDKSRRDAVYVSFKDEMSEVVLSEFAPSRPGVDADTFRKRAEAYLRQHEDNLSLRRLRSGRQLTEADLEELGRLLLESGAGDAEQIAEAISEAEGVGLLVRSLAGLDRKAAIEIFGDYLHGSDFNVDQIRFLGMIVDELSAGGVVDPARLFQSPFTDVSAAGPTALFAEPELRAIVRRLRDVKRAAEPA